ncbi:MAG TPA: response regulator, partial [Arenibaculum sp.]|nr:response regulator [Arenibaculum sp.]
MKIMVVENDPLTAAALAMILNDAGHHVVGPVASVRDALARVGPDAPDLVLVDVELGRGGSGIALARGLKRHYDVPSVF